MGQQDNKKLFYKIFLPIAIVAIGLVYIMPSPNAAKKNVPIKPNISSILEAVAAQNGLKITENNSAAEAEMQTELEQSYKIRRIARDVFRSPYVSDEEIKNEVLEQNTPEIKQPKEKAKINFKVRGVILGESGGSIILSDGRIFKEREVVDGFKLLSVEKGIVIFMSPDREIVKVSVWED